MNKVLFALCLLLFVFFSRSCDICSIYFELTPNDFKSKVGLFYSHRFLSGYPSTSGKKHGGHGNAWKDKLVKESFGTIEVRGEYFPVKWFSIFASIPIVHNTRQVDQTQYCDIWGVGDPYIMTKFRVLNTSKVEKPNHRITLGAGLKFPLGSITEEFQGVEQDLDMQPGTGSWDVLLSAEYLFVYKKFGMNTSFSYKLNTENKFGYGYGDNIFSQIDFIFLYQKGDFRFFPKTGLYFENASRDTFKKIKYDESGGSLLYMTFGFDAYWKGLQLVFLVQPTIAQSYNGLEIPAKVRLRAGVNYNF